MHGSTALKLKLSRRHHEAAELVFLNVADENAERLAGIGAPISAANYFRDPIL